MYFRDLPSGVRRKLTTVTHWSVLGTSHLALLLIAAGCFALGGFYVFAVNERAVYGYDMRVLEQEITALEKENATLRLREAEGRSLARVEAGSATLRMERAEPDQELIIERGGPIALR